MSKDLLTEEEMSALLPENEPRERKNQAVPYNFRRPDRLSKEQIRGLYLLHDQFAHSLSSDLPLLLRSICEVNLISVEQQAYGDYLRGLSDPTTLFSFSVEGFRGMFAIEMNSSIAFPIIDRMLGGDGKPDNEKRAATEVEMKVLEGFLPLVTDNYCEAWKTIAEFKAKPAGGETRPQMLQIAPPNEVVLAIAYQVQIGEAKGGMSICLPAAMLEPVIEKFTQASFTPGEAADPHSTFALLESLSHVRLPVSVELEKASAPVSDLMNIASGDVLLTDHRVEKPIQVLIGKAPKFTGRLGAQEGQKVLKISGSSANRSSRVAV